MAQASNQRGCQSHHRPCSVKLCCAAPDVHELCRGILDEAVAAARAEGVKLADDETAHTIATLHNFSGELGTSMYFDRLAGQRLEVEALTGAIVAAGERHGLATPLNRALLTLLRAINDAIAT